MRNHFIEFIDIDGCKVCISNKPNHDGYIRIWDKKEERLVMLHRYIYELVYGLIKDGYEIDHICKNRACSNPEHLLALPAKEHTIKGNKLRYKPEIDAAKEYWLKTKCTAKKLREKFDICTSKWITRWNKEYGIFEERRARNLRTNYR